MKTIRWTLALLGFCCAVLSGAPQDPPAPPQKDAGQQVPPQGRRRRMRGAMIWRAFARLDKNKQKELLALQHSDPEKFSVEMRKIGEQFFKEEQQRRSKVRAIVEKYQKSKDAKEKESLKKELTELERVEFQRSLDELSKILEESRRRVAFLEGELNKRSKNAGPAVDARVDALLKGEIRLDMPPPPPPRERPPRTKGNQ